LAAQRESWARLRDLLWMPPRPHGEQPQARVVGPLELFYDLVVVVLVTLAAHQLTVDLTWRGFGVFAAVFTVVWIAWFNGTLHHELHSRDDTRGRIIVLLQVLAMVVLGGFISAAGGARGAGFAFTASALFLLLALIWFFAARRDRPEYRHSSRLYVVGTAAFAAALAGSAFLPAGPRVVAWAGMGIAYLVGFTIVIGTATPIVANALRLTDALIERFGLLIIIVLGETVMGVVEGLTNTPVDALSLIVALVAVMAGFGAWWTYFDFAGHRPARPGWTTTSLWMITHLPLTAAIAVMGAAMVSLIEDAGATRTGVGTAWGLGGGAAVVLAGTALLSTSLRAWRDQPVLYRPLSLICVGAAVLCLGLSMVRPAPLVFGLVLLGLFSIPWVFAVGHLARTDTRAP
jgi:low temperature requirement protein LtrA